MVQLALREMPTLERQFWAYHSDHPEVYEMLVQYAKQWRDKRGAEAIGGMKMIWERVRWEMAIRASDETYKCNNNLHAYYARLIMERNPDLDGIFRLRRQRSQATIGPA